MSEPASDGSTSLPHRFPPSASPSPCADTGPSKTASTGSSMSSSRKTFPDCARDTGPKTWLSSATSRSTWSAPPKTAKASRPEEKPQAGSPNTFINYSSDPLVNPDSLPWGKTAVHAETGLSFEDHEERGRSSDQGA